MNRLVFRKEVLLYGLAGLCIGFAAVSIAGSQPEVERTDPRGPVNGPPARTVIAATGIIEPASETIRIVPEIEGRVASVFVKPGDIVKKGQALYTLDDSIPVAAANEALAQVELSRSEVLLQQANVASFRSAVDGLRYTHQQLVARVDRFRPLLPDAISPDEFEDLVTRANDAYYQLRTAETKLAAAQQTLAVARKALQLAGKKQQIAEAQKELTILRTPIDAQVLSINVRPGDVFRSPVNADLGIRIGNIDQLHIRAQVNETELARFDTRARATGYIRGATTTPLHLKFISYDTVLTGKVAAGDLSAEIIDSRNLNVLYRIEGNTSQLFVGQLVDVYIETELSDTTADDYTLSTILPAQAVNQPVSVLPTSLGLPQTMNENKSTRLRL